MMSWGLVPAPVRASWGGGDGWMVQERYREGAQQELVTRVEEVFYRATGSGPFIRPTDDSGTVQGRSGGWKLSCRVERVCGSSVVSERPVFMGSEVSRMNPKLWGAR